MLKSYRHTKAACYIGYVTQAIVNNLAPLLFLIFRNLLGISLAEVTVLVTVNFSAQLIVDCAFAKLADKIGYRTCLVGAHFFAAAGLLGMAFLPKIMPDKFAALLVSIIISAIGSGLIEVLISPTVEACPAKNKTAQMSLLHSYYCWGAAAVISLTTLFLFACGEQLWWVIPIVWAALPLVNAVYFLFVPIPTLAEEGRGMPMKRLFATKRFWILFALMMLGGAAELAMSQWASLFAENGLGVSKAVGDLTGPCLFALLMGLARLLFSRIGKHLRLFLALSGALCAGCYLIVWLVPVQAVALAGCALCGFSTGIFWPGVFSLATQQIPKGGTSMFAMLSMAGDIGCTAGPSIVGACADAFGGDVRTGLAFGLMFPVLFLLMLLCTLKTKKPALMQEAPQEPCQESMPDQEEKSV